MRYSIPLSFLLASLSLAACGGDVQPVVNNPDNAAAEHAEDRADKAEDKAEKAEDKAEKAEDKAEDAK